MQDFLALDWDDHQLIGIEAEAGSKSAHLKKWVQLSWSEEDRPSENPDVAGKKLRAALDKAGIDKPPVLVSLPREQAVVRVLEFPDCSDDELPDLVHFQAATRSSIPLDRLLLDYLPIPRQNDVPGRRALMVTLAKTTADRVQAFLAAAGLEASTLQLSSVGTAQLIAQEISRGQHEPNDATAALVITCIGSRVEMVATWHRQIVLMHAATLSQHDSPESQVAYILAETSRAAVALGQAAPGLRVGSGWLLGSPRDLPGLRAALNERFGFEFRALESPADVHGIRSDFPLEPDAAQAAFAPTGLLLGHSHRMLEAIDFLHPRKKVEKKDRRRLKQIVAGSTAAAIVVFGYIGIQVRAAQLERLKSETEASIRTRTKKLTDDAVLTDKAQSLDDWCRHDINWIGQFQQIKQAMGPGSDRLHLTSFDGSVANWSAGNALAVIVAKGKAKSRDDVEDLNDRLDDLGYRVKPREIVEDSTDPQFPEKIDLDIELITQPPQQVGPSQPTASLSKPPAQPEAKKPT